MTAESSYTPEMLEAALAACASEPVHIPGAIQGFGAILCLDTEFRHITQVSANIETVLGLALQDCLGASAPNVLSNRLLSRLRQEFLESDAPPAFSIRHQIRGQSRNLHVRAFRSGEQVVLELELLAGGGRYRWLALVSDWLERLVQTASEEEAGKRLVEAVRSISSHDRCLLYVFDEEYNGRVEAESRNENLPSMLGHHFPASDIPPQVRALYTRNRTRMIADCDAPAVPLVPKFAPGTGEALDLGAGVLRAAALVHREYMRNMGTRASLSIAIFDEHRLWGLVACHHTDALALPPSVRDSAAALVQMGSQRLFLLQAQRKARYRRQVHEKRVFLAKGAQHGKSPELLLHRYAPDWLELMQASGLALLYPDEVILTGIVPERDDLLNLRAWLSEKCPSLEPWCTDSLQEAGFGFSVPEAVSSAYCGLLAMPLMLGMASRGWLLFFRAEQMQTIKWAGQPEKGLSSVTGQVRLSPRKSFAAWQQTVRGKSAGWKPGELAAVRDLGDDFALIISAHQVSRLNEELKKEREALDAANRYLQEIAFTDSLTGIMNRYRIEHLVQMALANASRYQQGFSIVLFDIDHFKQVNDKHGHDEGDRILQELVDLLQACLREGDQLGRWGGEEFLVLLPATPLTGALVFAERMRESVAARDFGLHQAVTISLGVAEWQQGDTLKSLLVRADQAMYQAKRSGRNRVCAQET